MEIKIDKAQAQGFLAHLFSFKGRATRKEFWITAIGMILASVIILGITTLALMVPVLGYIVAALAAICFAAIAVAFISLVVRRFHDVGLSGFWIWYLLPVGLPVIYVVYMLDFDPACNQLVEKIKNVGSSWLGWILAGLFWSAGAPLVQLLIYFYAGQKCDNQFGENPYKAA